MFEKDGKIWYVTEEKGDKENLTEYLKKLIKDVTFGCGKGIISRNAKKNCLLFIKEEMLMKKKIFENNVSVFWQ